jgi:hypothetical protein
MSHGQALYLFVSSNQSGFRCSTLSCAETGLPARSSFSCFAESAESLGEAEEGSLWAILARSGLLHANGAGFTGFVHWSLLGPVWMDGVGLASVMRQHSPVRFSDCNKLWHYHWLSLV